MLVRYMGLDPFPDDLTPLRPADGANIPVTSLVSQASGEAPLFPGVNGASPENKYKKL